MTGLDPAVSRYSPGLLAMVAAIRGAAEEGDRTVHPLRGREGCNYPPGASGRATCRRVLRHTGGH